MFRALKTSRDQTWTYNKHTHEGASPPIFFIFFFWAHRKFELASTTCQNAGNQDLPFKSWSTSSPREIPEVPAMSPGDAPELYTPDVGISRDRLQVSKKWLLRTRSKHFGPLTWVFLKKLTMRGTFLWYRDVLLGSVWSSWWQQRQEIKTIFCVRLSKAHCLTLLTWSIIVVKH